MMVSLGDPAMGVRVAKIASYNDIILLSSLAPVVPLPKFPGAVTGPEPALVLGLTRQESEFDAGAVSTAGARGLMQLMPATAKQTAAAHRMTYRLKDLTADPKYNTARRWRAPRGYLEHGARTSAIAGYNAGTREQMGRSQPATRAIRPRSDRLDRTHPFGETRQLRSTRAGEYRATATARAAASRS